MSCSCRTTQLGVFVQGLVHAHKFEATCRRGLARLAPTGPRAGAAVQGRLFDVPRLRRSFHISAGRREQQGSATPSAPAETSPADVVSAVPGGAECGSASERTTTAASTEAAGEDSNVVLERAECGSANEGATAAASTVPVADISNAVSEKAGRDSSPERPIAAASAEADGDISKPVPERSECGSSPERATAAASTEPVADISSAVSERAGPERPIAVASTEATTIDLSAVPEVDGPDSSPDLPFWNTGDEEESSWRQRSRRRDTIESEGNVSYIGRPGRPSRERKTFVNRSTIGQAGRRDQNSASSTKTVDPTKRRDRNSATSATSQTGKKRKLERWQIQKEALKQKFPEGWNPRRRLSPDALVGIRALNAQFPDVYTTSTLADKFKVSPEAIRRVLRSKWQPSPEVEQARRDRWFRRGKQVWTRKAALGVKPPKKWRMEGIVRDPEYHEWSKRAALREQLWEEDELRKYREYRERLPDRRPRDRTP